MQVSGKNSKNNQHNLLQKENHKRMYYFLTEQKGFVDLPKLFKYVVIPTYMAI